MYILLALLVYGLFLLVTAPARFVVPYVERDLPPSLRVVDVRGTVWSGHLRLLVRAATGFRTLSRVGFDFSILPLVQGRLAYVLHFSGPLRGRTRAALGTQTAELSDVNVAADVTTLSAFVPAAQDFGPSGTLEVKSPRLLWGPKPAGQGELVWENAALVSAPVNPLGSYEAQFVLHGMSLHYRLQTLRGRLTVRGRGQIFVQTGSLSFAGDVRGHGLRLSGLLQNIGTPDGRGGRRIAFESTL